MEQISKLLKSPILWFILFWVIVFVIANIISPPKGTIAPVDGESGQEEFYQNSVRPD